MRLKILFIMLLCLPIVSATICEDTILNGESCIMLSPELICSSYTYDIYLENGTNTAYNQTLTNLNGSIYWFNFTNETGDYIINLCDGTTREFRVLNYDEEEMVSLGIIIFLLLLNGTLFYLPFKIRFSKSEAMNDIVKKFIWVLAWVILAFVITILTTLADNAGLGINDELFMFQWIFVKGIYILAIYLFLKTMVYVPKAIREHKEEKRMGKDER